MDDFISVIRDSAFTLYYFEYIQKKEVRFRKDIIIKKANRIILNWNADIIYYIQYVEEKLRDCKQELIQSHLQKYLREIRE